MKFKDYFSQVLEKKNIKVSDAAKLCGVTTSAIYAWKSGANVPNGKAIVRIAKGLNLDTETLRQFKMERPPARACVKDYFNRAVNNINNTRNEIDLLAAKHKEDAIAAKLASKIESVLEDAYKQMLSLKTYIDILNDE